MSKTRWIAGALVVLATVGSLKWLGYGSGAQAERDGQKFSVDTTPLGRLLDTPCTRKLFLSKFGAAEMVNDPKINIARHLTMRRLSDFPLARLNDQKLRAMQAEFSKLDPQSTECKRTDRMVALSSVGKEMKHVL